MQVVARGLGISKTGFPSCRYSPYVSCKLSKLQAFYTIDLDNLVPTNEMTELLQLESNRLFCLCQHRGVQFSQFFRIRDKITVVSRVIKCPWALINIHVNTA